MEHKEILKAIYAKAPIHDFYKGIQLNFEEDSARITLDITTKFHHAGHSTHGSVYFKMLDDAAYFSAQTKVIDYFILTANFNVQLFRPIIKGKYMAIGKVDQVSQNLITASAILVDEKGKVCAQGNGQFMKSTVKLSDL